MIAGLGLLVGAAVAAVGTDRQATFTNHLRETIRSFGIELLTARLGRDGERSVWVLTLRLPNQHVTTVNVPLRPKQDAFADETSNEVARRVGNHLAGRLGLA